MARALIANGIEPGDRVAIWSPNTHHWVLGGLGALYAGATLVPVNTRYTGPEALDVISRSRARALLVAGPFLGADRHALLAAAAAEAGRDAARPDRHDPGRAGPGAGGRAGLGGFRRARRPRFPRRPPMSGPPPWLPTM